MSEPVAPAADSPAIGLAIGPATGSPEEIAGAVRTTSAGVLARLERVRDGQPDLTTLDEYDEAMATLVNLSDLLNQEAQRGVHHVLVELRLFHAVGEHDLSDFARDAGPKPEHGSHETLRQ